MADCKILSRTTGAESKLYNQILKITENFEEEATEIYNSFSSPEFIKKFGDWENEFGSTNNTLGDRVNTMGEPLLTKYKYGNKYYYVDKYGNKQPVEINGIHTHLTHKDLREVASAVIASKYTAEDSRNFNIEKFSNSFSNLTNIIKEFLNNSERNLNDRYDIIINELKNKEKAGEDFSKELEQKEQNNTQLDYINEIRAFPEAFKDIVFEYLNTIGISSKNKLEKTKSENDEIVNETELEKTGREFNIASYEVNHKDSLSKNLKMDLSFIPSTTQLDVLGNPVYIPADSLINTLTNLLHDPDKSINEHGDVNDVFNDMRNKLYHFSKVLPQLTKVIELLDNYSEEQKNRFVQLGQSKINFNLTTISGVDGNLTYDMLNISEAMSNRKTLLNEWGDTFLSKYTIDGKIQKFSTKNLFSTFENYNNRIIEYNKIRNNISKNDKQKLDNQFINEFKNDILQLFGINVSPEALGAYLRGFSTEDALSTEKNKKPFKTLYSAVNQISYFVNKISKGKYSFKDDTEVVNPFENSQKVFTDLSGIEALLDNNLSENMVTSGGKQYYSYTLPSYLSQKISIIKNSRKSLIKMRENDPFNTNSKYIKDLLAEDEGLSEKDQIEESNRRISKVILFYFSAFKKDSKGKNSVDNGEIQFTDALSDYINKELLPIKGKTAIHRTITPADKKTGMEFSMGKFVESGVRYISEGTIHVSDEALNILAGYYEDEYIRAKLSYINVLKYEKAKEGKEKEEALSKLSIHKHFDKDGKTRDSSGKLVGNAFKMYLFPSLGEYNSSINEDLGLWNIDGSPTNVNIDDSSINAAKLTDSQKVSIKEAIKDSFIEKVLNNHEKALENNIFSLDEKDEIKNNFIDAEIWANYAQENDRSLSIIGDFTLNALMSQVEYGKIFLGDPSFYKNIDDYQKRAPSTYTTGIYPRIRKGSENRYFNIAVINPIEGATKFSKELKKALGNDVYDNVNIADGQAWITPKRWKFLISHTKGWNKDYTDVYAKLIGKDTKPLTIRQRKLSAQPLKGVYFNKDSNGIPTFLKYSQFVIHNGIAKGNGIERIYKKMLENNIDEVVTLDAIKVGSNLPVTIHNNDLSIKDDFELKKIQLDNRWWKIQQDLQSKGVKNNSKLSSQLMKNIFSSLTFNKNATINFRGQEISGEDMANYIDEISGRLSDIGIEELNKEWQIKDGKIENETAIYNSIINEYKSKGNLDMNIIGALEKEMSPLAVVQTYPKVLSILLSIIEKRTIDTKTPGGGFIQTSNFGIDDLSDQEQNSIMYFNEEGRKGLKPPLLTKNKDGRTTVSSGQLILSHSEFQKYFPGMTVEDIKNNIDPRMLKIVGYRIPNQALASSSPMEIVGVLPEGMGDTVIAYSEITKQTGSDFDIDKMYLMMPAFSVNKEGKLVYSEILTKKVKKESFNIKNEQIELKGGDISIKSKKENIKIDTENISKQGYKVDIKGYPNVSFFITKDKVVDGKIETIKNWEVQEKTTGMKFPVLGVTLKEILEDLTLKISSYSLKENTRKALNKVGFNYKNDENIEETLPISQQPKKAVQNLLLDAYRAVLKAPSNYKELMNPIDNPIIKDDIYSLIGKSENNSDLESFDPIHQLEIKFSFLGGKAGVGQSSNYLVDNSYSQHFKLILENARIPFTNTKNGNIELDLEKSLPLTDKEVKFYINKNKDSKVEDIKSLNIFNSISMIVNAFVDISKDSYITKANWNIQTTGVGLSLIRSGMHPFRVNALLNQPIIKEYTKELIKSYSLNSIFSGDIKNKLLAKYKFKSDNEKNKAFSNLDLETLTNDINSTSKSIEFNKRQSLVLESFLDFKNLLNPISRSIQGGKYDVSGFGGNLTTSLIYNNKLNSELDIKKETLSRIPNLSLKFINGTTLTMIGHKYNNSIKFLEELTKNNPKFLLLNNKTILNTYNYISNRLTGKQLEDAYLAKKMENSMYSYVMSGFKPFSYKKSSKKSKIYKDIFVDLKDDLKNYQKNNKDNDFVNSLLHLSNKRLDFFTINNNRKDDDFKNKMYNGWKELMEDNKSLSDRIAKFSFYQSGFINNFSEIYSYLPNEWLVENQISKYITELSKNMDINSDTFMDQFIKHNWRDSKIVKRIKASDTKSFVSKKSHYTNFEVKGEKFAVETVYSKFGKEVYNRYPSYLVLETQESTDGSKNEDLLYELSGYDNENGHGVYTRTNKLGIKSKRTNMIEYSYKSKSFQSIVKSNNLHDTHVAKINLVIDNQDDFVDVNRYEDDRGLGINSETRNIFETIENTKAFLEKKQKIMGETNFVNIENEEMKSIDDILNCRL